MDNVNERALVLRVETFLLDEMKLNMAHGSVLEKHIASIIQEAILKWENYKGQQTEEKNSRDDIVVWTNNKGTRRGILRGSQAHTRSGVYVFQTLVEGAWQDD